MNADTATVTIDGRFCGPDDSGNGGYSCALLAAQVQGPARVRLLAPPPLDRALDVCPGPEGVELRDGETVIARAWPAALALEVPAPPDLTQARAAASHYPGLGHHAFPHCFVCGPRRPPGDGLRIFPGPVGVPGQVACTWTPDPGLADDAGEVLNRYVWAALDCPSGWAHIHASGQPAVLGEFSVGIDAAVRAGVEHILLGWQIGAEGRKLFSGSALFTADGEPLARARATWIRLR